MNPSEASAATSIPRRLSLRRWEVTSGGGGRRGRYIADAIELQRRRPRLHLFTDRHKLGRSHRAILRYSVIDIPGQRRDGVFHLLQPTTHRPPSTMTGPCALGDCRRRGGLRSALVDRLAGQEADRYAADAWHRPRVALPFTSARRRSRSGVFVLRSEAAHHTHAARPLHGTRAALVIWPWGQVLQNAHDRGKAVDAGLGQLRASGWDHHGNAQRPARYHFEMFRLALGPRRGAHHRPDRFTRPDRPRTRVGPVKGLFLWSFSDLGCARTLRASGTGYTDRPRPREAIPRAGRRDLLAGPERHRQTAAFVLRCSSDGAHQTRQRDAQARPRVRALILTRRGSWRSGRASVRDPWRPRPPAPVALDRHLRGGGCAQSPRCGGGRDLVATARPVLDHAGSERRPRGVEILVPGRGRSLLDMGLSATSDRSCLLPDRRQNLLFSPRLERDSIAGGGDAGSAASVQVTRATRRPTGAPGSSTRRPVAQREQLSHLVRTRAVDQGHSLHRTKHGANKLSEQCEGRLSRRPRSTSNKSQAQRVRA